MIQHVNITYYEGVGVLGLPKYLLPLWFSVIVVGRRIRATKNHIFYHQLDGKTMYFIIRRH